MSNSLLNPVELLTALGEPKQYLENILPGWTEAMSTMPDSLPPVLSPLEITANAAWSGLEPEVAEALCQLAEKCWNDKYLRAWLWYCIYQLNRSDSPQHFHGAPLLKNALNEQSGMFYLLVATSIVPLAVANYRKQGINDALIRNTLLEIRCFCNNHRVSNQGLPGLLLPQLSWLRCYRDAQIYRLGRLEFKLDHARDFGMIMERKSDGVKVILAENGRRFDHEGYIEYDNCPDEQFWIADLEETVDHVAGYPIAPEGYAENQRMVFPLSDWRIMARHGAPMIDMHIPSGGGLTPDACRNSLALAADFFTRRYPAENLRFIWCHSWIFNPQWQEKIPQSNMAAFQRELYLFPVKSQPHDGMFFVFCGNCTDPAILPRETSLQKAMLEILDSGRKLRASGMFFAIDDLDKYGTQYYRSNRLQ